MIDLFLGIALGVAVLAFVNHEMREAKEREAERLRRWDELERIQRERARA